jgi:hypothetical protein
MAVAERQARARERAARTVEWAHSRLALSFGEIGAVVDADERSVRRWRSQEVAPQARHQARLETLDDLRFRLEQVFETREHLVDWLDTSLKAFRGQSPATMLRRGPVTDVIGVLATMESGAFV